MDVFPPPIKLEPLKRPRRTRPAAGRAPDTLRTLRERKGVTLEEIAERTRIPIRHLLELERGDVSDWPAGIYARAWARAYAVEVGIDPERVIAMVSPVAEVEPSIEEIRQAREERERSAAEPGQSTLTPLAQLMRRIAAVALVVTLMALAALLFRQDGGNDRMRETPVPVGTSGVTPSQAPR